MDFLRNYGYDKLQALYSRPVSELQPVMKQPNGIIFDAPIYQGRDLFANVLVEMTVNRWKNPKFIVGNEMGAVLALFVALGMNAEEIFNNWSNGLFDPDTLLFGKRRLHRSLGFLHPLKAGALHKGARLSKAIDDLLRSKYELGKKARMTLAELNGKTHVSLHINAYSVTKNDGVLLSHENYPEMPVSEAIMCSLARFPILKVREWRKEVFIARSTSMPIPLVEIKTVYDAWGGAQAGFVQDLRIYSIAALGVEKKDMEFTMLVARPEIERQYYNQELVKCFKVYKAGFKVEDW